MSRKSLQALNLTTITALAAATALPAQTPERVSLTGSRVAIWDIAGQVTLAPTSGRSVIVAVTRRGPDAARLEIAHGPIGGRETLRVIFPGDEIIYSDRDQVTGRWSTEFRVNDNGTFSDDNDHGDRRSRSGGRRMRVRGNGNGTEASADLDIQVPAGQEINVYLAAGTITARNLNGKILLDTHGADVSATAMKGVLDIDTGSGDVRVDGMDGPLNVDVGSGDVTLSAVKGTTFEIDAGSGDVRGAAIASDVLRVDTGSGNVELDGIVSQDVQVDVGSGDVELAWAADPGEVGIDSGSGEITLTFPSASGATVDLESSSGDISSDFEITTTRIERDTLRGTFGDGKGRIAVETGSGDVRLVKR